MVKKIKIVPKRLIQMKTLVIQKDLKGLNMEMTMTLKMMIKDRMVIETKKTVKSIRAKSK